jgi:hypothetical protein
MHSAHVSNTTVTHGWCQSVAIRDMQLASRLAVQCSATQPHDTDLHGSESKYTHPSSVQQREASSASFIHHDELNKSLLAFLQA